MKFGDLLQYLEMHTDFDILDGTPDETLAKALDGSHRNAYAGELIKAAADNLGLETVEDAPARVEFVNSLGKLRLKYMADDAPVEGFRLVEKIITTADAAYNEEALRQKQQG
ncbi:MAG: hypothetical protein PVH47_08830 [Thiohalocapsa sp.]|jgi:hypothetical protein